MCVCAGAQDDDGAARHEGRGTGHGARVRCACDARAMHVRCACKPPRCRRQVLALERESLMAVAEYFPEVYSQLRRLFGCTGTSIASTLQHSTH